MTYVEDGASESGKKSLLADAVAVTSRTSVGLLHDASTTMMNKKIMVIYGSVW